MWIRNGDIGGGREGGCRGRREEGEGVLNSGKGLTLEELCLLWAPLGEMY